MGDPIIKPVPIKSSQQKDIEKAKALAKESV